MRVTGITRNFANCDVTRLVITTLAGTQFVITEKDGALRITAARPMFVQWDDASDEVARRGQYPEGCGERACEVRQLERQVCPEK